MKFQRFLCLFLVLFACCLCSSHSYTFYVGGKEGWVLHPKEKYNDWAGKQRFQVNDTLIFKYEKGSDSVLLVKKVNYYKCERKEPLMELSNGSSEFQFPHSGPFFFISGKEGHCQKGQKLITVVMAERHRSPSTHPPPKSPFPGPAHSPKHHGPIANPPTAITPGPAQSPYHHGPVSVPPTASSPAPSSVPTLSPTAHGPIHSPAPSTHHAPEPGPSQSPTAHGPIVYPPISTSPSPPPSIPAFSPSLSVSSPPAPPQDLSPSGSQGPSGSQAGTRAAGPVSSATATYSSVMVLIASALFSMIFGSFVGGF